MLIRSAVVNGGLDSAFFPLNLDWFFEGNLVFLRVIVILIVVERLEVLVGFLRIGGVWVGLLALGFVRTLHFPSRVGEEAGLVVVLLLEGGVVFLESLGLVFGRRE